MTATSTVTSAATGIRCVGAAVRALRQRLRSERGSFLVWIPAALLAGVLLAGLAIDGAGQLSTSRQAVAVAQEAARAGANALDSTTATSGTYIQLNVAAARQAATAYAADAGMSAGMQLSTPTTLTVTVTTTYEPRVLPIGTLTITSTASADLKRGIDREVP